MPFDRRGALGIRFRRDGPVHLVHSEVSYPAGSFVRVSDATGTSLAHIVISADQLVEAPEEIAEEAALSGLVENDPTAVAFGQPYPSVVQPAGSAEHVLDRHGDNRFAQSAIEALFGGATPRPGLPRGRDRQTVDGGGSNP